MAELYCNKYKKHAELVSNTQINLDRSIATFRCVKGQIDDYECFEKADSTKELKLPDIAEKAETFTVLVGCWE